MHAWFAKLVSFRNWVYLLLEKHFLAFLSTCTNCILMLCKIWIWSIDWIFFYNLVPFHAIITNHSLLSLLFSDTHVHVLTFGWPIFLYWVFVSQSWLCLLASFFYSIDGCVWNFTRHIYFLLESIFWLKNQVLFKNVSFDYFNILILSDLESVSY